MHSAMSFAFLFFVIPVKTGIQEVSEITGYRPTRLCRNVIAREGNDRSNLISSRIHKITTTPERRLVMTKKNCDTICYAGMTK